MSPPEILWAQRSSSDDATRNIIYLTINAPDLQSGYSLTFPTSSSLSFKGTSGGPKAANPKSFEIDSLQLFGEIDLEADRRERLTGKSLQVVLTKKDLKEEYWPRLTKDKRVNFVKTDFALWVDEDEQDGAAVDEGFASTGAPPGAGMDMEAMMAQMGGMGGLGGMGGMPGMGGMGGMPGMGGMGGMPGMPGMGGMPTPGGTRGSGGDGGGMDLEKLMAQMKAERGDGADDDSKSDDSTSSDEMPTLDEPTPK
ncbi:hypothetical protein PTTG_12008 [Puccinia triticina 1-1 BBBD Race 1]|uniref:CS domain-containing protein n=2 Tax=Puccinia triticina TaxID=208348 RepID=A0A180GYG9_PUCT1|nr:uncharacterized protein PtA15_15A404 [Puccinia triticina]OAV97887.1 hypothetical protein PTTG_12008 [Puccinia triticina 1-1 BBBD Race 1]WAQ92010.1 hypothetical protein PtA15_15A404 [Puccinia triticina]WAR62820.1 hypothetical protein PtB15_15B408 [Puccinia triticina]